MGTMQLGLNYYLRRLAQTPPHKALPKAWRVVKTQAVDFLEEQRDLRQTTYGSSCAEEGWDRPKLSLLLKGFKPDFTKEQVSDLERSAKMVLEHKFDLLGSGPIQVGYGLKAPGFLGLVFPPGRTVTTDQEGRWLQSKLPRGARKSAHQVWRLISEDYRPIDWQIDFRSGYRWSEHIWSQRIPYGNVPGADIKVPWELARMQHLPRLALMAHYVGETTSFSREDLAREFCNQILDFIAVNPPRFGVNWICSMEVGIRLANWLLAYDIFRATGAIFDELFERILSQSIQDHANHIMSHLEWHETYRGNHYIFNLVGLIFAGVYLPSDDSADAWLAYAIPALLREIDHQFLQDGGNFEASTTYHLLSLEALTYALAALSELPAERSELSQNDLKRLPEKLKCMVEFAEDICGSDGAPLQIGDNDDGRLFMLGLAAPRKESQSVMSARETICAAKTLLKEITSKGGQLSLEPGTPVMSPLITSVCRQPLNHQACRKKGWISYPDFGLFLYRKQPFFLGLRTVTNGRHHLGGHAHNDGLSLLLHVEGQAFFIDAGTCVYTADHEQRNTFRATSIHNTLSIQGQDQNPINSSREHLFTLPDQAQVDVVELASDHISLHARYASYEHRREVTINDRKLIVCDHCLKKGEKHVSLMVPSDITLMPDGPSRIALIGEKGHLILETCGEQLHVVEGQWSPGYGRLASGHILKIKMTTPAIRWTVEMCDFEV